MTVRRIKPARGELDAVVRSVPSKSVTHRALVCAALAQGESRILDPLEADDTRFTRDGLAALGVPIDPSAANWRVAGRAGSLPGGGQLFLGDSGTSMRFLVAVAALGAAASTLDGSPRLRERPVRELAATLERLGGSLRLDAKGGGLPLSAGGSVLHGGKVEIEASQSSQFASALLLIGPHLRGGLEVRLSPPAVSLPYVELTVQVLEAFGAEVERCDPLCWQVREAPLRGREFRVEGDHSSASYFLAAPAVRGGRVRVEGISPASKQPDACLGPILARLGCEVETGSDWIEVRGTGRIPAFDLDMAEAPDVVPTLAVLALFADGACALRGIEHLRYKESDRLEVLAENLRRLGRDATAVEDRLLIGEATGGLKAARIRTASDHRMAMAFAVAGLRLGGVELDDAPCVAKSNPGFWDDFRRLQVSAGKG